MRRVIHLLPYDGIGGAEEAARSMAQGSTPGLDFRLQYLFERADASGRRFATFNPFAFLVALRTILAADPDLLIVSLWRSCIVGILVRLVRRRIKLVVLIHNSVDAHLADRLATRLTMALCDAVWVDSEASIRTRFARRPRAPVTVISFLTRRLEPLRPLDAAVLPAPTFVFWGRLASQKNLSRAIMLFHRIHMARHDALFTVVGPDGGQRKHLQSLCGELGIAGSVHFAGPMEFQEICAVAREHAFYLQTSDYEGMAMAVVEAMQLGLVPVVTPVGEVGSYCLDQYNGLHVGPMDQTTDALKKLLEHVECFREMRVNAIKTWEGKPIYRDAIVRACLAACEPSSLAGHE